MCTSMYVDTKLITSYNCIYAYSYSCSGADPGGGGGLGV